MNNPWLEIPLNDYEGHMAADAVRQSAALAELFAEALALRRPASVAILGVAGGNGLERIDSRITQRVAGIDFHPDYLAATRLRFALLHGLELHCIDLAQETVHLPPVEMVHAALIFEHAGLERCLDNALALTGENGALCVVIQLPGAPGQDVGQGGFASIEKLKSHFALVDRTRLRVLLHKCGFAPVHETHRALPAGKAFWMGVFARA